MVENVGAEICENLKVLSRQMKNLGLIACYLLNDPICDKKVALVNLLYRNIALTSWPIEEVSRKTVLHGDEKLGRRKRAVRNQEFTSSALSVTNLCVMDAFFISQQLI